MTPCVTWHAFTLVSGSQTVLWWSLWPPLSLVAWLCLWADCLFLNYAHTICGFHHTPSLTTGACYGGLLCVPWLSLCLLCILRLEWEKYDTVVVVYASFVWEGIILLGMFVIIFWHLLYELRLWAELCCLMASFCYIYMYFVIIDSGVNYSNVFLCLLRTWRTSCVLLERLRLRMPTSKE